MTLGEHKMKQVITVPELIRRHPVVVMVAGFIAWAGAALAWLPEPDSFQENQLLATLLLTLASSIVGATLGYRSRGLDGIRPFRTSLGLSWRIAAVWVVLVAISEWGQTDDAVLTVTTFPMVLLPQMVIVAASYLAGFAVALIQNGMRNLSRSELLQAIAAAGAVVAAVVAVYATVVSELGQSPKATDLEQPEPRSNMQSQSSHRGDRQEQPALRPTRSAVDTRAARGGAERRQWHRNMADGLDAVEVEQRRT